MPGRLDPRVRDRIVAETRGNPLALLELPRGLSAGELAGGFGRPDAQPLAGRIEQSFLRRLESLPSPTQRLLLTAAAEPLGDVPLLHGAAERLGIGPDAALPAEAAGLVEIDLRVRFRHPLVRAAAYRAATAPDRREVHRALAEATDPGADPDRRAWHRAHAAVGPDEVVAAELERSAGRAAGRGGVAAEAAFLERATQLTPDPRRRGPRALAAARAQLDAGSWDEASELLAEAEACPLDELQEAQLVRLHARIAFARSRGSDAPPLLLEAARRLEPLDAGLARETYLDALGAAIFAGRLAEGAGVDQVAEAARRAPPGPQPPQTTGPAPRRPDHPLHRRIRRRGPSPPARPGGPAGPGRHRDRPPPLAVDGVPDRVGALGGRDLGRAGDPPRPRRPGDRRPRRPPPRPHLPLRHARPCRRVRRGGGPDRGVGRHHAIHRRRAPHVHDRPARRLAGPGGPGRRPHRGRPPGCDPPRRGSGGRLGRLRHRPAPQRPRRLRRRAGRRPCRLCARRHRSRRLADDRADRGRRPQRPSRGRRRPPSSGWRSGPGLLARTGRSGWRHAPAPC